MQFVATNQCNIKTHQPSPTIKTQEKSEKSCLEKGKDMVDKVGQLTTYGVLWTLSVVQHCCFWWGAAKELSGTNKNSTPPV